ncbi:hypothetical protein HK100_005619 [Physocladia obscura]|uniref:Uncharacterized protein n=1 Tax=Physocladia obscura TaxID=109957 RepID=A0AAD5XIT2_9FUNG|nr:hypothetical protein HK100_005619 [Physocladia obscura]
MSSVSNNAMGPVLDADPEISDILSTHQIKHDAIHALHEKHKESTIHHFTDAHLHDHINSWKVLKHAEEQVAYGVNYFAKVQIGEDKTIHIRIHRQKSAEIYDFYSLHETIKHNEVTCIWAVDEPLVYFNA